jgi:hypothetical protein
MRTLHIIIGAALMAAFVIGCSKSSKETPTVQFGGYIDAAGKHVGGGASQATFEFKNPTASLIICAVHIQPDGLHDVNISIQPNSTKNVVLWLGKINVETLSVTVLRVVSSRELSVPMP